MGKSPKDGILSGERTGAGRRNEMTKVAPMSVSETEKTVTGEVGKKRIKVVLTYSRSVAVNNRIPQG